jgi:hypothetical protein
MFLPRRNAFAVPALAGYPSWRSLNPTTILALSGGEAQVIAFGDEQKAASYRMLHFSSTPGDHETELMQVHPNHTHISFLHITHCLPSNRTMGTYVPQRVHQRVRLADMSCVLRIATRFASW